MNAHRKLIVLLSAAIALSLWSCKENVVSVGIPIAVRISGTVFDENSSTPLNNASVVLVAGSVKDSTATKSDGTFQFVVEIPDSVKGEIITLTVSGVGYIARTI
ncbi:MAG: hypothetical protein ACPL1K_05595, partial [Candidatus Kryptoniota bacterium]